ncbi:SH3 domain-containing protein [Treponema bryantii]|uniref:SH3 domain-containing protein n=1 Tax=Treponema bryantii TaxID=163 RepID=A0A1H9JS94_9SPIR|nr:SH3 domain-containing protein [Treponema bryantii]SEQ89679.1 SH3 domain-containing protein [Treponema bryantii]
MERNKLVHIKKTLLVFINVFILSNLFSQNVLKAEFELLAEYKDENKKLLNFYANDYESYSPLGPIIDSNGKLIFFNSLNNKFVFDRNSFFEDKTKNTYIDGIAYLNAVSSNGISVNQSKQIYTYKNADCQLNIFPEDKEYPRNYILFNNSILFIEDKMEDSFMLSFEGNGIKEIPYKDLQNWLNNNNFELGDGIITYNNQLYGSFYENWFEDSSLYGRLRNNYIIIPDDNSNCPRNFTIQTFDGKDKLTLEMNYSLAKNCENFVVSWGIGNYGEIYVLQGEDLNTPSRKYSSKNGTAKLYVIRNHLKNYGILNDDKIRLRKGPGTNTESLGTYPIKTGFRILEKSGVKQTIGGVTDEWIKVRLLDGTEGYFFGQYVQNLYDGPGTPLPWPNVPDWD